MYSIQLNVVKENRMGTMVQTQWRNNIKQLFRFYRLHEINQ